MREHGNIKRWKSKDWKNGLPEEESFWKLRDSGL